MLNASSKNSAQMKHKSKPAKVHQKYTLSLTTHTLLLKISTKLTFIQKEVIDIKILIELIY